MRIGKSFLLFYAQDLDFTSDSLGTTRYRLVVFRVQDFLKYQNNYCLPKYYFYQLKKLLIFFDELQENSLIKIFSDKQYRSLVTIPEVNLEKSNKKKRLRRQNRRRLPKREPKFINF